MRLWIFSLSFCLSPMIWAQEKLNLDQLRAAIDSPAECTLPIRLKEGQKVGKFLFEDSGACYFYSSRYSAHFQPALPITLYDDQTIELKIPEGTYSCVITGVRADGNFFSCINHVLFKNQDVTFFGDSSVIYKKSWIGRPIHKQVIVDNVHRQLTYYNGQGKLRDFTFRILESDCLYLANLNPNSTIKCIELEAATGEMITIEVPNKMSWVKVVLNENQQVVSYQVIESNWPGPVVNFFTRTIPDHLYVFFTYILGRSFGCP